MSKLPSPAEHPNTAAALIAGYLATAIVYGAKKAGISLTLPEASTGATALIGLALFVAGKKAK